MFYTINKGIAKKDSLTNYYEMKPTITCPQCKKPVTWTDNPSRPFCSERCKLIDLGNWASEKYKVPAESQNVETLDDANDAEDYDSTVKH